jgi:hypothetical protein
MLISIGTKTAWGEVKMEGNLQGERYYWIIDDNNVASMVPASTVEEKYSGKNGMLNAKQEFIKHVEDKQVLCAILRLEHTESEYTTFLNALDFEYESGYGRQILFGNIWYKDGTWSDRSEYDGLEWWEYQQVPEIPKNLKG